jgi:serine/threonine-protein kinase
MAAALEKALAPATASQVSEWVESIANDILGARAAQIADIESRSSSLPVPRVDPATDVPSGVGSANISVSSNSPVREAPSPARRRGTVVAIGIGALVLVPLAGVTVVRAFTSDKPRVDDGVLAPAASASATAFVVPSASIVPALSVAPDHSGAPATSVMVHPQVPVPAAPLPPSSAEGHGAKKTGPARSSCNPPFTFDGAGMKHYKPECF